VKLYTLPKISDGDKVIVGLGDSFTQGIGSWSRDTYAKYNNKIDIHKIPRELYDELYKGSWVNQLCENHLTDYISVNLGKMGNGNRSAVKQLYLNPSSNLKNASHVIVIFMLSGIERFDFINKDFNQDHPFYTMWPNPNDPGSTHAGLWEIYSKFIWSDKFEVAEAILNIMEAYTFCKANGYDFIFGSAFDIHITRKHFISILGEDYTDLVDSIPWDNFFYPHGRATLIELLTELDGRPSLAKGGFYPFYTKLPCPSTYITNCAHPTKEGHKAIAEALYSYIRQKKINGKS
jgi:lysophospholipase L1-like esterase